MGKFVLFILVFAIFIHACKETSEPQAFDEDEKEPARLSDMQVTACNTAHEAGTCETRLQELGIVLKEDCCEVLGKCC